MKLYNILSNHYALDGGAMFGNAPKALWSRWMPPDEQNRLRMATRAMLAVTTKDVILFEAGIGAYLEPKLRERFGVTEPEHMLLKSLAQRGVSEMDVTHIFLSHLHFDHAGGLFSAWQDGRKPDLLFPNARYFVGETAWERATHPVMRDRASFIPALHQKLEDSQRLSLIRKGEAFSFDGLELRFFQSDGHTPGLLCFDLRFGENRLVYASDLAAGRPWVHLPITMGYDRCPEQLMDEKCAILTSLAKDDGWLFYVHDPDVAVSRIQVDEPRQSFVAVEHQPELVM